MTAELPRTADFVILGAGVMGASIAFHLARRGAGRIVVVDKGDVACGGSGRSSALVRMHYSFPPEVDLAVKSLEIFRAWHDYVGRDGHFRETGFVRIVPERDLPRLEKNVAMQREHGVDARVVTRRELSEIEPDWVVDDVPLAAWEPGSGYGDGSGVATDFLERARELGATYVSGTRVTGFRGTEGRRGHRRRHGPRRGLGSPGGLGRRAVEPAALRRRRIRPSGRAGVPRGRRAEEPARDEGARPRLHRRDHDDLLPQRGRRPDARRRLLGPPRRGSRRVPAVSVDRFAREA